MGRPPKVGGLRTTRIGGEASEPEPSVLPDKKTGMFQFRSRATALRYSVRRRRVLRGPDNEAIEEAVRSTDGTDTAIDWVKFEDNYFETPSRELAEALIDKAKKMGQYGVGLELWSLDDEKSAHDKAKENELRRLIAENPNLAARVLKPSESDDFVLPPPAV
jgi:hypothetical protein